MTEYSAEVMQMARSVARQVSPTYDSKDVAVAALAIVQTTELAAKWSEDVYGSGKPDESTDGDCVALDLRTFSHLPTAEKADGSASCP